MVRNGIHLCICSARPPACTQSNQKCTIARSFNISYYGGFNDCLLVPERSAQEQHFPIWCTIVQQKRTQTIFSKNLEGCRDGSPKDGQGIQTLPII